MTFVEYVLLALYHREYTLDEDIAMLKCSFNVKKLINSDVIIVFREVKFSVSYLFCCFCAVHVVRASTKSETVTESWLAQSIVVLNNYTSKY